jgi:L-alanine-DL-glutamate epimerase-like enolase superfamily enzyme
LSSDDRSDYEDKLNSAVTAWNRGELNGDNIHKLLIDWPSIRFGFEMAIKDLATEHPFIYFNSQFSRGELGIETNGLIWMGDKGFMQEQLEDKLEAGFGCIKLKIGALDWNTEHELLKNLRSLYSVEKLELRVDANGAFDEAVVYDRLKDLENLDIHSIEQPIKPGNWELMSELVKADLMPVALDEELIGINESGKKKQLLQAVKPHYIILKPSLVGGWAACEEWIRFAEELSIGWWATSALESNIGLAAISQWVSTMDLNLPQGLGTGSLFENNVTSPLEIRGTKLWANPKLRWQNPF